MADNEEGFQSKFPLKYGITAKFLEEEWKDISSFTVLRCPITKTASFALMSLNMTAKHYMAIEHAIRNNRFELITVSFDIRANYDVADQIEPPKIDDLGQKQYLALHIEPYEEVHPWSPYVIATLYLVNPVLYYLQVTNGFNKILEDITASDALGKFEDYLKESYGDSAFQFVKIGEDFEKNDWKFEQILCRQDHDLMIPTHIINSYKLWHTYGYYFFDDFRFDDQSKGDINALLINLGDITKFDTMNIMDSSRTEMFAANMFLGAQTIADRFNALYQQKPSLIVKGYDMQFGFRKSEAEKGVPQLKTSTSDASYSSTVDNAKIVNTDISSKQIKATEQTLVYAPDDIENGIKRFDKVSAQLREQIHSIDTYYIHDSHLDFIQFQNRYNLSPYDINDYSYVPIAICNMFVRETGRVPIFTHNLKYQVLKYKKKDSQGGTLSGGNFEDYPVS